jgi:hypothetical protein
VIAALVVLLLLGIWWFIGYTVESAADWQLAQRKEP